MTFGCCGLRSLVVIAGMALSTVGLAQPRVERCAWLDESELVAALRGEAVDAEVTVRDCGPTTARLEARWAEGSRSSVVELADVPERARARTVALLLADLVALGPEPPARVPPNALAASSGDPSQSEERMDPPHVAHVRPLDGSTTSTLDAPRARSGTGHRAAPADAETSAVVATLPNDADAVPAVDANPAADADPAVDADPAEDPNAGAAAVSGATREARRPWHDGLAFEVEGQARIFWARAQTLAPGLRLAARWRWLVLGIGAFGNRPSTQSGDVGALALLARLSLRPLNVAIGAWRGGGEIFGEGGLVRIQGHPHGADTLGSLVRAPALGGGARLTLGRQLGRAMLGVTLEVAYLRGLVGIDQTRPDLSSCTLGPCEPTHPEAGGLHGPSVGVGLVLVR